jgi:hypothetical protein
MNRVLTAAEIGLPGSQFEAFRRLMLDEFGRSGFEATLKQRLGTGPEDLKPDNLDRNGHGAGTIGTERGCAMGESGETNTG